MLEDEAAPAAIWGSAYADAGAWPRWNAELKSAKLDGPLRAGVYVEGPLAWPWRRVLGAAIRPPCVLAPLGPALASHIREFR